MSSKCVVCRKAFVSAPGQMCITCKLRQQSVNPYGSAAPAVAESKVQEMPTGIVKEQVPPCDGKSFTGIIQNVHKEQRKKNLFVKWWNSVRYGSPFPLTDTQYEFTLYSQGNYTAEQAGGHEVVLYGEPGYSFLNNNGHVRVIGKIDRNGVIQAREINGLNTNFRMCPRSVISGSVIRVLSVIMLLSILGGVYFLVNAEAEQNVCIPGGGAMLFTLVMLAAAYFVFKLKIRKRFLICAILIGIGLLPVSAVLSAVIFAVLILIAMVKMK